MNAPRQSTLTIDRALSWGRLVLAKHHVTPNPDALWLLEHCMNCSHTYLLTHHNALLPFGQWETYQQLIQRRCTDEPLAYICAKTLFRHISLKIDARALIPRPETEQLLDFALQDLDIASKSTIADLGTGSGAIAIALAQERPNISVLATDNSKDALSLAEENVVKAGYQSRIELRLGDWCTALDRRRNFSMLISNPPYISVHDLALNTRSLSYEPKVALVAEDDGMKALHSIIAHGKKYLQIEKPLWLEHSAAQAEWVRATLRTYGWQQVRTECDLESRPLFSCGIRAS